MKRARVLISPWLLVASSCTLYDADLLEQAQGGASDDDGDGDGDDATGGALGTGGREGPGSGSAGPGAGGTSPGGGGGGSGGASNGSGGGEATGGQTGTGGQACDESVGEKGETTGHETTLLVDDFDTEWTELGPHFDGWWFAAGDMNGAGLSPTDLDWHYDQDPCLSPGDTSLHITGSGYDSWGASYDANLDKDLEAVDLSAYSGVTFWARSSASPHDRILVALSDTDDENGTGSIAAGTKLIGEQWQQFDVPFDVTSNLAQAQVLHLAIVASGAFDVWIDDLVLYTEPSL